MKLIVIGAVAAGTSAAAKASRNDKNAEIVIYEKDEHISYSGCGTPYYLGRHVTDVEDIAPRDPAYFKETYGIDIKIRHEVLKIDPKLKTVQVKNLVTKEVFVDHYDKLILATGARSFIPPFKGRDLPHVFALRSVKDMLAIEHFINTKNPRKVAIIGSGFIGLELAENFHHIGLGVTLIEKLPQVSPSLDADMAHLVENHLKEKGVQVLTNQNIEEINEKGVLLENNGTVSAELIIVATGVKPNVELAKEAGVLLGITGAIAVDDYMQTNLPDIYACGDNIEEKHIVTGKPVYRPMGSTANKTGRVAGDNVTGGKVAFPGIVSTAIYRAFDLTVAQTGLTEKEALQAGYTILISKDSKPNRTEFFKTDEMLIKTVMNQKDGRILGAQIIGGDGVDKRIDVFATAITFQATASDLAQLDLAYSPVYSMARDPIIQTGMILEGLLKKAHKK